MKVNGEAIYGTRSIPPYKDGQVVFTSKRKNVYAIYLLKSETELLPAQISFVGPKPKPGAHLTLLGFKTALEWHLGPSDKITVEVPPLAQQSPPCLHAVALRFETLDTQ
jgi:alpha-L-fucosidase